MSFLGLEMTAAQALESELMTELATFLETFLGSPVRADGTWVHTLMFVDGGYFNARVRNAPVAELFVTPRSLDGFELTLRGERIKPDASFDTAFTVSTNDHELARLWLDPVARTQILGSAYEYHVGESYVEGLGVEPLRPGIPFRRIWTYELANDELVATKGNVETQLDRLALALETAAVIAARTCGGLPSTQRSRSGSARSVSPRSSSVVRRS